MVETTVLSGEAEVNKIKQSAGSAAVRGGRIDKKFGKGHAILAIIVFGAWLWYGANIDAVRYRLTLEIETPQGLRSASSVIQNFYEEGFVRCRGRVLNTSVTSEAVYVDLDPGRHVIALLDGQVFDDFVGRRGDVA